MKNLNPEKVIEVCHKKFHGTVIVDAWGETGIFYNPDKKLSRGVYVMTVKCKDGDNDKASQIDREGVYRINTGISKDNFKEIFGAIPARPKVGEVVDMLFDFTAKNVIMPHPVYAWMGWVCVLNPTEETFDKFLKYVEESYELAKSKYHKKIRSKKGFERDQG